jgi:hypothetical protein
MKRTSRGVIPPGTILDDEDLDLVRGRTWHIGLPGYVEAQTTIRLHCEIVGRCIGRPLTGSEMVDHINGDKLDNRRANLRVVSASENGCNRMRANRNSRSGIRGVHLDKRTRLWVAQASPNRKNHFLGRHKTAALAEAAVLAFWETMPPATRR